MTDNKQEEFLCYIEEINPGESRCDDQCQRCISIQEARAKVASLRKSQREAKEEQPSKPINLDRFYEVLGNTSQENINVIKEYMNTLEKEEQPDQSPEADTETTDEFKMKNRLAQKEEVIEAEIEDILLSQHGNLVGYKMAAKAISDKFKGIKEENKRLQSEVNELRAWKESAMSVTPDMQKIGRLLNVRLGDSIHDKIIPGIQQLQSEIERLKGNKI